MARISDPSKAGRKRTVGRPATALLLLLLAHGVGHVDDADDDPDQAHEHDGGAARGPLEHNRGHRQGDQHGPEGQREGLPAGAVGPLGPHHAPFGPDHASGPAALVPAPRVPVQLGQDAAVHLRRDPVVDLGRDPLVDVRADAFHQALGQRLVIAGAKVLPGGHRGGDLSLAIRGHHALRTFRQPLQKRYGPRQASGMRLPPVASWGFPHPVRLIPRSRLLTVCAARPRRGQAAPFAGIRPVQ